MNADPAIKPLRTGWQLPNEHIVDKEHSTCQRFPA
jgi:hypothetical protein